jgi:TonB-dependent starch-binding outer membrane protein SusC
MEKSELIRNGIKRFNKNGKVLIGAIVFLAMVFVVGLMQVFGTGTGSIDRMELIKSPNVQQGINVTGVVSDANTGETLPGVSVAVRGTALGTVTDIDGRYTLLVSGPSDFLVFSFVGYTSQEIEVGSQRAINVGLAPAVTALDEIVVIGYGTQRRGDITGSVSSVGENDFQRGNVRDAAQLIQGRTAGLRVGVTSGDPTAGSQISLRGITTLVGDASPLVIIDGVPGSLRTVAPEDIESIDILKDGAAAAIYGTRGTNGVILITTRKAKKGVSIIEYSSYVGIQAVANQLDFLDASDYRRLKAEGRDFIDFGYDTDWFSEVIRANPFNHTQNFLVQGSSEKSDYTASVNFREWEGLFLRSDNSETRMRLDANHSMLNDKLKVNANIISRQQKYWTGGDGYSFDATVYRQALIRNPTDRLRDDEGNWQERAVYQYFNPLAQIMETDGENKLRTMRLSGSILYQPIENLNIKLLLSNSTSSEIRGTAQTKQHNSTTIYGRNGFASRGTSDSEDFLLEFTTDYVVELNNHRVTALAGYGFQERTWENYWMQNWDFPTDLYSYNNMGAGNAITRGEAPISSYKASSRLIGFFGRVNYNYNDRYLVMASLRREGSSRFGADHQWGLFPSLSAGWRVSQESFMEGVLGGNLNNLMLRAGYGVTGIEPASPYLSMTTLNYGARFYYQGQWIQSLEPAQNPNPNLRWEQKTEVNLGLEFSLFNHRFGGSFDVYRRETTDMLWNFSVPVPPFLYGSMMANVGVTENTGVEVFLHGVPVRTQDFQWRTNLNYSTNNNKLISLSDDTFQTAHDFFAAGHTGEPVQEWTHRVRIGGPIGNFWGYKSVDIDENGRWIIEKPDGTRIPIDQSNPDDKQVLGNGIPKHVLGWNHQFSYKRVDLGVSMRGAFGFQILNFARLYYENPRITHYNMLKDAYHDVYGKRELNNDLAYVSYYVEDGDYWKVDNITLGYNFDFQQIDFIRNARVYVSAQNFLTITGYKGIDPEVNFGGLSPGMDHRDKYPTTKTLTVGINLSL